jgi:hypothetical protein
MDLRYKVHARGLVKLISLSMTSGKQPAHLLATSVVHIESDSHNLVRALQTTDFVLAPEGTVYRVPTHQSLC